MKTNINISGEWLDVVDQKKKEAKALKWIVRILSWYGFKIERLNINVDRVDGRRNNGKRAKGNQR